MAINYQSAFNSGELSGRMNGRSSLEVYKNGCSRLENFYVLPQGGVERRTGTEFISETTGRAKMIPFVFSSTQSYAVEIGDGYITVWDDETPILVTDSSPYVDADLDDLEFVQRFDILYIQSPNKNIYQVNRVTLDPTFTLTEIEYDYPPLLDENETDVTMTPSGIDGFITLTASEDFFSPDHVGAFFVFEQPRLTDNASINAVSPDTTNTHISDWLNVSNANWDFSTSGNSWNGRVSIERTLDGGNTIEELVIVGDTTGSEKQNFSYSSPAREYLNAQVRVRYIESGASTINYLLKTDDPWTAIVKVTGYTSATEVVCEVISPFQDVSTGVDTVNYTDYPPHDPAKVYQVGETCRVDEEINSINNVDLKTITGGAGISNITGMDYDGTDFWLSESGGDIWKVTGDLSTASVEFNASSGTIKDIALYGGDIFLLTEITIAGRGVFVRKYNSSGVFQSTVLSFPVFAENNTGYGLGYYDNHFYISYDEERNTTQTRKYTSSWSYTGIKINNVRLDDITGDNLRVWGGITSSNSLKVYNENLVQQSEFTATSPSGLAFKDGNLFSVQSDGVLDEYKITSETSYYECVSPTTAQGFPFQYADGEWQERSPALIKTWQEGAFSDYRGWPRAIAFHEDRLWLAGSTNEPSTIHGSVSGDYYNFAPNDTPDGAIRRIPDNPELAQWLVGRRRMIMGTEGGAIVVSSVDDRELIDASNIKTASQAVFGASAIPAIEANDVIVYAERSNKKLREFVFSDDDQNYRSANMNILNDEILDEQITELFLQQQPDQVIWATKTDGTMAHLTYERVQEVVGWGRFITDGNIQSACRLPSGASEDEIWMCVLRNGKYMIERTRARNEDWFLDSAVDAITGLDHLEGLTVRCVVDGVDGGTYVVSGGSITPAATGSAYLTGLDYDSILRTMPIEPNLMSKLPNSRVKGAVKAIAEFYPTKGGFIGEAGGELEGITTGDGVTPAEINGELDFNVQNEWTREKVIEIKQSLPYPMVVLSLAVWTEAKGG